jgi:hypothetical protein
MNIDIDVNSPYLVVVLVVLVVTGESGSTVSHECTFCGCRYSVCWY